MTDDTKFRMAIAALGVALLLGTLYSVSTLLKAPQAGLAPTSGQATTTADDPTADATRAMTFTQPKAPKP
jgi:hypothetical protein